MMIDNAFRFMTGKNGSSISRAFKEGIGKSAWRWIISGI